jgi:multidrug resistance efflux pump
MRKTPWTSSLLLIALLAPLASCATLKGNTVSSTLKASGTISAHTVQVAAEVGGRIVEVSADKGETVKAGDILFRLDDQLLRAQRTLTEAAGRAAVAAAQLEVTSAQQALDALYENAPLAAAQAEMNLADARKALDDAQRLRSYQQKGNRAAPEDIDATEAELVLANDAVDKAQRNYNNLSYLSETNTRRAAALAALEAARKQRDALQRNLNWLTGQPTDIDQGVLDARVTIAQAQVTDAERRLSDLKPGPDPDALALAQASLTQAQAHLDAARAQAEVDLQTLDLQLGKLTVHSPSAGMVLTRSVEPGEVVAAGATVMEIGTLDQVTLTVYIPENQYGDIHLAQKATVAVDSFPGKTFNGSVTYISDQAEFTPRNVQTVESRSTTVYKIEITLPNPAYDLKPGMPADATF